MESRWATTEGCDHGGLWQVFTTEGSGRNWVVGLGSRPNVVQLRFRETAYW